MSKIKKVFALLLVSSFLLSLCVPAYATDSLDGSVQAPAEICASGADVDPDLLPFAESEVPLTDGDAETQPVDDGEQQATLFATVSTYFSCSATIYTTSGTVVNLYKNPGDSSRYDYFSKGQTAYSTYGANMSDGSVWYRVGVNSLGVDMYLWLKASSSGVTLSVSPGISFSTSSLSINNGSSSVVSFTFQGSGIQSLSCSISCYPGDMS